MTSMCTPNLWRGVFYLGMFDDTLCEMEVGLEVEGKDGELYQAITAEYRQWLAELTDEQRRRLAEHNYGQNSANKNWLLEELLEGDYGMSRAASV